LSLKVERWGKEENPRAVELREALEREGYSVFEWSDAPGTHYSAHRHPEDQSHWIISEEFRATLIHYARATVTFFPRTPSTPHSFQAGSLFVIS
jgi:hypothetical protein